MATTEAEKKTFYARVTIIGKPGGGGDGGDGGGDGGDGGGNGGDGGDGGGNGGNGGAVHPGPEPIPPGGLLPGGGRPRGFRTVEFDPADAPQASHPSPPGKWVVVDAGRGKPPVFGFMSVDHGLEGGGGDGGDGGGNGDGDKPQIPRPGPPGTNPPPGQQAKKGKSDEGDGKLPGPGGRESKGHWVAVQYPMKAPKSADPVFVWVPQIDENFGVRHKSGNGNGNGNGEED